MPADNYGEIDSERPVQYAVGESGEVYTVPQLLTPSTFQTLLSQVNTFIFDADGK